MSILKDFFFVCRDYPVIYHAVYSSYDDEYTVSWTSQNFPEGASESGYTISNVTGYLADGTWIIVDSPEWKEDADFNMDSIL